MIEERKYCEEIMKKEFKKNFVMTKRDNENFRKASELWICGKSYVDVHVKIRDLFHKTGKLLIEFVKLISNLIAKFILCFTT